MFIVGHLLDEGYRVLASSGEEASYVARGELASDKRGIHDIQLGGRLNGWDVADAFRTPRGRFRTVRGKCRGARFYLSHTFPATLSNSSNGGLRNLLFWHKADIRIGRLHRLLLIQSGHS